MNREEFYALVFDSKVFKEWHWFKWHFEHHLRGTEHPFTQSIADACLRCETKLPGFGEEFVDRLSSISGREKNEDDWEQLLQLLAELLIIDQSLSFPWSSESKPVWEPTSATSKKNPEIELRLGSLRLGVEVKAPALLKHIRERHKNETQLTSRALSHEDIAQLPNPDRGITYPRDNPVKDFLLSADSKFEGFKAEDPAYVGLLVIVWDDFIQEPISALVHENSGLLTNNSFARDPAGNPLRFPNIDGVIVVRHLHQLMHGCRGEPYEDHCSHALDYGREGEFPFKAFMRGHGPNDVPEEVLRCYQALPQEAIMGAEYHPIEVTWWF